MYAMNIYRSFLMLSMCPKKIAKQLFMCHLHCVGYYKKCRDNILRRWLYNTTLILPDFSFYVNESPAGTETSTYTKPLRIGAGMQ